MRIAFLILSLLFALFAGFQYNDADGWIWILIYGNIALLCFMAFRGKFFKWWSIASFIIYAGYFFYLTPAIIEFFSDDFQENLGSAMSFDKEYIEQTREAGGLLICILALAVLHIGSRKKK